MNSFSDLLRHRGVLAAVLGAGIFIGATGLFVIRSIFQERKKRLLLQHLARLDLSVTELRQELLALRNSRQLSSSRQSLRSSSSRSCRKSTNSDYETDGEMFSALDTDDEEFFDLSSEEEELLLRTISEHKEKEIDEKLQQLFEEVDVLLKGNDEDRLKGLDLLQKNEEEYSNNPDFLWRMAKAYQIQAKTQAAKEDSSLKKKFVMQGLEYAEKALSTDLTNPDAHKWYAILVGMLGEFQSTKEKIQNGYLFQKHVAAALEEKPNDYSLHHLSGRFKYEIAKLSWIEKKVASTLFAEVPTFTFQDAIPDFLKAEDLNPVGWKENRFLLGQCYIGEGKYEEALSWLDAAKEVQAQTDDDRLCEQEVDVLLAKYDKYRK